ncbi:MAG: hypothetical protein HUU20_09215 [Pirellulales bacterium]|nr:hypothetical protein [Pirellulales bacterium]
MTSDGPSITGHSRRSHEDSDVPVKVAYESFVQFDRWLDSELEKLIAHWAHTAAPNALRHAQGTHRGANQKT